MDLYVIGAGAAGIAITRELADQPCKICLLESGDFSWNWEAQTLCTGDNIGQPLSLPAVSQLLYFGGTTNHWQGVFHPIEVTNTEPRSTSIPPGGRLPERI